MIIDMYHGLLWSSNMEICVSNGGERAHAPATVAASDEQVKIGDSESDSLRVSSPLFQALTYQPKDIFLTSC
jgi:hypothetical protein